MMCGGPDGTPTYALTLTLIGMQEEGPMIVMWLYKLLANHYDRVGQPVRALEMIDQAWTAHNFPFACLMANDP